MGNSSALLKLNFSITLHYQLSTLTKKTSQSVKGQIGLVYGFPVRYQAMILFILKSHKQPGLVEITSLQPIQRQTKISIRQQQQQTKRQLASSKQLPLDWPPCFVLHQLHILLLLHSFLSSLSVYFIISISYICLYLVNCCRQHI